MNEEIQTTLEVEIKKIINVNSLENESDTPDFILADYLNRCFNIFNHFVKKRDQWYTGTRDLKKQLAEARKEAKGLEEGLRHIKRHQEQVTDKKSAHLSTTWRIADRYLGQHKKSREGEGK